MNSNQLAEKISLESEREKTISKMKFCIISCYKSQMSKNRLLMFALENKYQI